MAAAVAAQRDVRPGQHFAVELDLLHTSADTSAVVDHDVIAGLVVAEGELEAGPGPRDAGLQDEPRAAQPEPEHPLDAGAVHPGRRTGVPGPAAAPDVRALAIDVGRGHIGLDLVAVHAGACARM